MSNFETAIEVIGQATFEMWPQLEPETKQAVDNVIDCARTGYVLVKWPQSQEYMEEDWFDEEAIFCGGSEEKTGSSAYFIPINRVI
jgi:hypothetical protein